MQLHVVKLFIFSYNLAETFGAIGNVSYYARQVGNSSRVTTRSTSSGTSIRDIHLRVRIILGDVRTGTRCGSIVRVPAPWAWALDKLVTEQALIFVGACVRVGRSLSQKQSCCHELLNLGVERSPDTAYARQQFHLVGRVLSARRSVEDLRPNMKQSAMVRC